MFEHVGEIAGVEAVAVVHRTGATRIESSRQERRATFGQRAKARRSRVRQKRTSTSSPRSQVTAMLSAVEIGVDGGELP